MDKKGIDFSSRQEILLDEKPIKISRRIERAVIYYLAGEHRSVSRAELIDLLWPDSDELDTRAALRTALSRLRRELPNPDILITDRDQISLDLNRSRIDLLRFENLYQNVQKTLTVYKTNHVLPSQVIQKLQAALAFWHGNSFLQGENFDPYPELVNWCRLLNNKLVHQRKNLLARLAYHHKQTGLLIQALDYFMELSRIDPLDVPIHLEVLDCLTRLGRFQESLRYCDDLEDIYEHQFNAPLPEAILERCQHSRIQIDLSQTQTRNRWPIPLNRELTLIGRQAELNQLMQAFYQGGIVSIKGEAGTGKTRLVRELFHLLSPQPALILATAREMEQSLPLSPLIHSLRRDIPKDIWVSLDPVWAKQLCVILPELAEFRNDCISVPGSERHVAKQHLFDSMHHVLLDYANQTGKLLIFLDDAHWADQQTLEAVSYLVMQGFFDQHGLLVIASRIEEPNDILDAMINQFYRSQAITEIDISNLNIEELQQLCGQIMGRTPSDQFVDRLFYETNGNPLIALEIIESVLDSSVDHENGPESSALPLPSNVQALIRRRLNQLNEGARYVLLMAAVIGSTFPLKLFQSLIHASVYSEREVLEPLLLSGYLQCANQAKYPVTNLHFPHEKMREVVLKEATSVQLIMLHRLVAEHLSAGIHAKSRAAVIADHFLAANDYKKAFQWYLSAADYAWSFGAKDNTKQAFRQAEKLLLDSGLELFDKEDILKLYQQWREFGYQAYQADLLEEIGLKLSGFAERTKDPVLSGWAQVSLSNACMIRNQSEDAIALIEDAILNFKTSNSLLDMVQAKVIKGHYYWWRPDYQASLQTAQIIKQFCKAHFPDESQTKEFVFQARLLESISYYGQGEATKAWDCAQATHREYYHQMNPLNQVRSLSALAQAAYLIGDVKLTRTYSLEAIHLSHAMENDFIIELQILSLGNAEVVMGHLDHAYLHATQALALGEEHQKVEAIVAAHTILGDIFIILHNYAKAHSHYRHAQLRGSSTPNSLATLENNIHLARMLTWTGEPKEARTLITNTLTHCQEAGLGSQYVTGILVDGICDLIEENYIKAEEKFKEAIAMSKEKGISFGLQWSQIRLAKLKLIQQDYKTARNMIDEVFQAAQELQMTWLLFYCYNLYIQLNKTNHIEAISPDIQKALDNLIEKLDQNVQSEALIEDYRNARANWVERKLYP